MMQKIEKVLDLAAEALSVYIRNNSGTAGYDAVPLAASVKEPPKPRASKKAAPAPEPASPFGTKEAAAAPAEDASKPSIEDAAEAQRRCQEVMVAFIRRFKDSKPNGPLRAQQLVLEVCGRKVSDFAALQYSDHVKLIPVFERELDAAPVA